MTTPGERNEAGALDALVELGRDSAHQPTRSELEAGLKALRDRMDVRRVQRRWVASVATLVVMLLLPVVWMFGGQWFAPEPTSLTYEIEGGSVLEGGYLRESGQEGITLAFNEGTRCVLTTGARARLRTVDDTNVRVGLENGHAAIEVTPTPGRTWEVEAGPFLVTVKGTSFTVAWDPSSERFELNLTRGRVVVSGPVTGGDLTLRAGQRLVVSLPRAETVITEASADAATDALESPPPSPPSAEADQSPEQEAEATGPEATDEVHQPSATTPGSTPSKGRGARRWAEELANGRWDNILADVEQAGVASTLSSAGSEDLFALATAARYRRRNDLARQALLALRRRFPQSGRALDATFLLGRVEESRGGGVHGAMSWYEEYLARAPSGTYAAEALGRKMTLVRKSSGPIQAKPIAKDYLRRFPRGSYAGSARALLDDR